MAGLAPFGNAAELWKVTRGTVRLRRRRAFLALMLLWASCATPSCSRRREVSRLKDQANSVLRNSEIIGGAVWVGNAIEPPEHDWEVSVIGLRDDQIHDLRRALNRLERMMLHVDRSPITDAGLRELSGVGGIQELVISDCARITDDGLRHLVCFRELRGLYIWRLSITDKGISHLAELRQLRVISVDDTGASRRSLEELRVSLPTTHFLQNN